MIRESKHRIVLIEPSEIVTAGITALIDRNPEFSVVKVLGNITYFNNTNTDADILIINPAVIDYNDRLDIRSFTGTSNMAIVALVHSNYEESVLRQYDECIGIYDNASRIIQKIRKQKRRILLLIMQYS